MDNITSIDELYFDCDKPKPKKDEIRSYVAIDLRADATGGWGSTDTDSKEADWTTPSGWDLINFTTQILEESGDRRQNVTKTTNGIHASVWAKGHPKGEANNRSYIHITVTVEIKKL